MSFPPLPPARVFAEVVPPPPAGSEGRENKPPRVSGGFLLPPGREVHVSGSAELSAAPDRAEVIVRLRSRKGEAGAARSSVSRRLDYVAQAARQRGGVSENDVAVTRKFSKTDNAYEMEAEVCITFSDLGKMQDVCNVLVEKLNSSVIISPPYFYHTMEAVDALRRQVCLAAVGSAQQKAQEVCKLFGQYLGKPLLIREEEADAVPYLDRIVQRSSMPPGTHEKDTVQPIGFVPSVNLQNHPQREFHLDIWENKGSIPHE